MKTATHYSALRQIIGCCFFILATYTANAQTRGKVEVIKDARIDTLAARRLEAARTTSGGASSAGVYTTTQGYRVQFFFGQSRAEAYAAQSRLQARYPELRTYITYSEPNFKVRAGDFRTRLEAAKLVQELRPVFPTLFIISEKINPSAQ